MKRIKRPVMNSGSIVKADEEEVLPYKRVILAACWAMEIRGGALLIEHLPLQP